MTAVSERPLALRRPYTGVRFRRVAGIAVVASLLTMFALDATVALSPVMGRYGCRSRSGCRSSTPRFATPPPRVDDERVTFGYLGRAQAYRGGQLIVRRDRSGDRLKVAPRNRRRTLARLRGDASAVDALGAAGAEIAPRRN